MPASGLVPACLIDFPAGRVQIIGVGAAVIGDMSSRPYWGIYELDFVFSTLVVSHLAQAWQVP